jgi:hypothetical protein
MRLPGGLLVQAPRAQRLSLGISLSPQTAHAMSSYALLVLLAGSLSPLISRVRIHRYSRGHVTVQATLAGRGLYVSKTPYGAWGHLGTTSI